MSDSVIITREAATELLVGIFEARDLPSDEARLVAEGLVWADLRGIESHGLVRIPQYMLRLDKGIVNPRPQIKIIRETPAAVVIDGDHSHGQIALKLAIEKALEKAKQVSVGWVVVGDTTHTGAVSMYTRQIAEALEFNKADRPGSFSALLPVFFVIPKAVNIELLILIFF